MDAQQPSDTAVIRGRWMVMSWRVAALVMTGFRGEVQGMGHNEATARMTAAPRSASTTRIAGWRHVPRPWCG